MNRREFLSALGIGTAALAINPESLIGSPVCQVYKGYPYPHFTGFKESVFNAPPVVAGQFLWKVLYETEDKTDVTFWYVNCSLYTEKLRNKSHDELRSYVRASLTNSVLTYVRMMDGIIEKANTGLVEVTDSPRIKAGSWPNPSYDPDHAKTCDESGCLQCIPEIIDWRNPDIPARRIKLLSYLDVHDFDIPIKSYDPLNLSHVIDDLVERSSVRLESRLPLAQTGELVERTDG